MQRFTPIAALVSTVLLAACAHPRLQEPPTHVKPVSASKPQILTAVLDSEDRPPYHFERVVVEEPQEIVVSRAQAAQKDVLNSIKTGGAKRILFFLPGYNTSFALGAADAARIAQIVDPQTLVIYSDWGSKGKLTAYRRDGQSARRNAPALEQLVDFIHTQLPSLELNIFAHSMGSRVAIQGIAISKSEHQPLGIAHVILAAPDLTVRDYLAAMRQLSDIRHGTIYVSRRDKALFASAILHLHHRLGQTAIERLNLPRTDIIDVTNEDHTQLGHSYAIHDPAILRDIYDIVIDRPQPHSVWCRAKETWVWRYCLRR